MKLKISDQGEKQGLEPVKRLLLCHEGEDLRNLQFLIKEIFSRIYSQEYFYSWFYYAIILAIILFI